MVFVKLPPVLLMLSGLVILKVGFFFSFVCQTRIDHYILDSILAVGAGLPSFPENGSPGLHTHIFISFAHKASCLLPSLCAVYPPTLTESPYVAQVGLELNILPWL